VSYIFSFLIVAEIKKRVNHPSEKSSLFLLLLLAKYIIFIKIELWLKRLETLDVPLTLPIEFGCKVIIAYVAQVIQDKNILQAFLTYRIS